MHGVIQIMSYWFLIKYLLKYQWLYKVSKTRYDGTNCSKYPKSNCQFLIFFMNSNRFVYKTEPYISLWKNKWYKTMDCADKNRCIFVLQLLELESFICEIWLVKCTQSSLLGCDYRKSKIIHLGNTGVYATVMWVANIDTYNIFSLNMW